MLSADESDRIKLKAIEQAFQQARLARTLPVHLLPVVNPWPFPLSEDDKRFLRELPYPISPA